MYGKFIENYESDKVSMEIVECVGCGYHLGIDSTFLEQVGDINTTCPSCAEHIYYGRDDTSDLTCNECASDVDLCECHKEDA